MWVYIDVGVAIGCALFLLYGPGSKPRRNRASDEGD